MKSVIAAMALIASASALANTVCTGNGLTIEVKQGVNTDSQVAITRFFNGVGSTRVYNTKYVGSVTGDVDYKYYSPEFGGLFLHTFDQGPSDLYVQGSGSRWQYHYAINCK